MKSQLNPSVETMLSTPGRRILFVHVGKCAGESILTHLYHHLGEEFSVFEMHVYQSNVLIEQVLSQHADSFEILIAKRSPIERFVSAFNWDKHNLHLAQLASREKPLNYDRWYETMPTVNDLGLALGSADPELQKMAVQFSRFAHMGCGQAWYTPLSLLQRVPIDRINVIDVATISSDLERFLSAVLGYTPQSKAPLLHTKGDYQNLYENGDALFPKTLSADARRNLEERLAEDFEVYEWLNGTQPR
jgi:hypothetical protein